MLKEQLIYAQPQEVGLKSLAKNFIQMMKKETTQRILESHL
jgi:hypothetical protein